MHFLRTTLLLASCLLLSFVWVACNSETDDEVTDIPNNDNLGNPTLNQFAITSDDELLATVDATSGTGQAIIEFDQYNEVIGLPDYHNGVVYVATENNSVNAIDIASRQLLWSTPILEYEFSSLNSAFVVYDDGLVYCSGYTGVVVAIEAATGDVVWAYSLHPSRDLDEQYLSSGVPIVQGDRLYVLVEENIFGYPAFLYIFDKKTGEALNQLELPNDYSGTLTFADNMFLLPAGDLYAVDAETFDILWQVDFARVSTASVAGDKVLVHAVPPEDDISSAIYCLDLNTGAVQWQQEAGFDRVRAPVVAGDLVFVAYEEAKQIAGIRNGRPAAMRIADGEIIWSREDLNINGSPVVANGQLYFHGYEILGDADDTDGFFCLDATNGEIVWFNSAFGLRDGITPLVVANNGVFGPGYYRN